MKVTSLWAASTFVAMAKALEIAKDTVTLKRVNFKVGGIAIAPKAHWAAFDTDFAEFNGPLKVNSQSGLYLVNRKSDTFEVAFFEGTLENDGVISFHSEKAAKIKLGAHLDSFINRGEMFVGGKVLDDQGNTWEILAPEWQNDGLLAFYQDKRNGNSISLGGMSATMENNGDICVYNSKLSVWTQIVGDGCVHLIGDVVMEMQSDSPSGQTIQFDPKSTGVVVMSSWSHMSDPLVIRGFGKGMGIEIHTPIDTISYEENMLKLEWDFMGFKESISVDIGPGYSADKFKFSSREAEFWGGLENNIVEYDGPVPADAAIGANCGVCKPTADPPNPPPATSTSALPSSSTGKQTETGSTLSESIISGETESSSVQITSDGTETTTLISITSDESGFTLSSESETTSTGSETTTLISITSDESVSTTTDETESTVSGSATTVSNETETVSGSASSDETDATGSAATSNETESAGSVTSDKTDATGSVTSDNTDATGSPTISNETDATASVTNTSTETASNVSEPTTSDETETTTPTPTTSNETDPNLPGPTSTERTTESSSESMWSPLPSDTRPTCDIHASATVTAPVVTVTVYV
ncbi:hypothetical protein DICA4_E29536 [Diutina catenulata]